MTDNDDHNGGLVAALRSVWFYYIACTPCRKIGHRRETRKEAERERVIKARLEMEQPGLYRHPNPENTNQYWMEDINMGPSLPKRGVSQNTSQRKLKSSGTEVTDRTNGASSPRDRQTSIGSSTHFHSAETASSPTVVAEDYELRTTLSMSVTDSQDLDWNRKRYEREDEELWGHQMANKAGQRLRDVITKGRDTAGRLFETGRPPREREITEDDRSQFYGTPRNPPVNDYHPPVVSSRPSSRNEYRWMLQPPPPAKVMEGKVPVSRSGSQTSIASRGSRGSRASRKTTTAASHASKEELGLGRLVGERIVKDKIRKGELPNEAEGSIRTARPDTRRSRTGSTLSSMPSQRSHRSHVSARSRSNTTGSSDSSDTIYERRMKKRASKQKKAEAAAGSEADDETDNEEQRPHGGEGYAVQRPRLQTIASSDLSSKKSEASSPAANPTILATMSGTTPATESVQSSQGSPLEDVTNRSAPTAVASPAATADKERPAGASVDSGLALS